MSIITLLTDFGSSSPYAAQMKAVLLGLCRATIVDITHDAPPHDITHAAYLLRAAAPAFPAGTIHLAVVDPGVGTPRQPLAVASGGQFFVGPDNGLLGPAARASDQARAFVIDVDRFARRPLSSTFHGRDVFAPVAAALANGLPIEAVGPPAASLVELPWEPAARGPGWLRGRLLYCDRFGNLVTNIPGTWLNDVPRRLILQSPRGRIPIRRGRTYADGAEGAPVAIVGSDGMVEIAVFAGRAAEALGLEAGDELVLSFTSNPSS